MPKFHCVLLFVFFILNVKIINTVYMEVFILQLISPSKLVPMIMKHRSRQSLAVAMTNKLFDRATRIASNCNGKDHKRKLDPVKMSYVRKKSYEVFKDEIKLDEEEKNWKKVCIVSYVLSP